MNFSVNKPTVQTFEEIDRTPLADGAHVVQITKVEVGHSKGRNCPMLIIRMTDVREDSKDKGKSFKHYVVLVNEPWGIGRLIALCRVLGVVGAGDSPDGLNPEDETSAMTCLLGKVLVVKTLYKETPRNDGKDGVFRSYEVDAYSRPKASTTASIEAIHGGIPPLPDDAKTSFDGTRQIGASRDGLDDSGKEANVADTSSFSESDLPF